MKNILIKSLSAVLAIGGISILIYVFSPIITYEIFSKDRFDSLLSPVPQGEVLNPQTKDFTKVSNWFENTSPQNFTTPVSVYYSLSITKLEIDKAIVAMGNDDLTKNLVQYPGTALPGSRGTSVIFGHSILPQFYNPKDYVSIFSTLPTLKIGDDIKIDYDGITYTYKIYEMIEVRPNEVTKILEQKMDDSYITLVTCTPPGHPLKPRRLLVKAKISPL